MKKKWLGLAMSMIAASGLLSGSFAHAEVVPGVTLTDVTNHLPGDTITLTGTAVYQDVLVKIMTPNRTILYYSDIPVAGGRFTNAITIPEQAASGTYSIVVGQGSDVAVDTFQIGSADAGSGTGGDSGGSTGSIPGSGLGGIVPIAIPAEPPPAPTPSKDLNVEPVMKQGQKKSVLEAKSSVEGSTVQASVASEALTKAFADAANGQIAAVVPIPAEQGQQANLTLTPDNLGILQRMGSGSSLIVTTGTASVSLPDSMFKRLSADNQVNVKIQEQDPSSFASQAGGAAVIGSPVSFEVTALKDGQLSPIALNAQDYVLRSFVIGETFDTDHAGVLYTENNQEIHAIPAKFTKNDDRTVTVTINRPGFSTYAVVTNSKRYDDIAASYASSRIQSLSDKSLLSGTSDHTYSPKESVTRAEFAAMLRRALGLSAGQGHVFLDVQANDWYAQDVAAIYEAGIVKGVNAEHFAPNAKITREDLTVMLSKALQLLDVKPSQPSVTSYLDHGTFDSYAAGSIQTVTDLGIMSGVPASGGVKFMPHDATTREAAAMLLFNFLHQTHLID